MVRQIKLFKCINFYCVFVVITGNGALYRFDTLGSVERIAALCAGRGEKLIQPLIDERVRGEYQTPGGDDEMWTEIGTAEDGQKFKSFP
jgi:20S proteasome alpha/beta subunit